MIWVLAGQGVAILGTVAGVRLLTGAVGPEAYGQLALGLTVVTLAQQTLLSPLSGAAIRFYATASGRGEGAAFARALGGLIAKASAALVAAALIPLVVLVVKGRTEWAALGGFAVLLAILGGACSALDGMQNAARRRLVVAWHDGLAPWLRFTAAVVLVRALAPSGAVAMAGYALATAIVLVSQAVFFRRSLGAGAASRDREDASAHREWTARIRSYAWPFATWGLFSWAQLAGDRWALETFASTSVVGFYAVLYQLGYFPMTLLSGLLTQLVAPVLFERAGDGSEPSRVEQARRLNRRLVLAVLVLGGAATALAFFFHDLAFRLLVDARYRDVSRYLPWMVLSGALFAAAQTSVLSILSGPSSKPLVAPKIVTAIVGVALAFAGAARAGLSGVVIAGLISASAYGLWILTLSRRRRT